VKAWKSVDWTLSNANIANIQGVNIKTVAKYRCAFGQKRETPAQSVDKKLARADWSKTNAEIAREFGVDLESAAKRRPVGTVPAKQLARRELEESVDWTSVDWSKSDGQIAYQKRVLISTVVSNRAKREANDNV
jgi:hypothetical protein